MRVNRRQPKKATMSLPASARLRAPDTVIHNTFDDGESVLLHLGTESYFGLNPVGTRMWLVLTQAESIEQACGQLLAEYAVEPDVLRRDLDALIDQLLEHRLLVVLDPDER
jgi:hypothetical protein